MTKIGFKITCLTPPLGTQLAGHAILDRKATGVHDDLFCRAIVIENNGVDYCIIQNDLIGVDYDFVSVVKEGIVALGIKDENILVGVTHTHSGPKGLVKNVKGTPEQVELTRGKYNEELVKQYQKNMIEAAEIALSNKVSCTMRYGFSEIFGISSNRNDKNKAGDPNLLAMEFIREDGKKILVYNFSCHPTIMNHGNYLITADYPHGVAKNSEGINHEMVMFLNGSAGDVSTRFTRKEKSFEEIDRVGKIIWDKITEALEKAEVVDIEEMTIKNATYRISLKEAESVADAQAKFDRYKAELKEAVEKNMPDIRTYESFVEGAQFGLIRAHIHTGEEFAEIHYKILKINDLSFVFVPSELFSDLTNPLKEKYGNKLLFCTYFNGSMGYIADKASYDNDTYETQTSNFERGQGEAFMADIEKQL